MNIVINMKERKVFIEDFPFVSGVAENSEIIAALSKFSSEHKLKFSCNGNNFDIFTKINISKIVSNDLWDFGKEFGVEEYAPTIVKQFIEAWLQSERGKKFIDDVIDHNYKHVEEMFQQKMDINQSPTSES